MLIHNGNIQQECPGISQKITHADFISLDLEFTGLYKKDPKHKINYFSSVEDVYTALRESVKHYKPLQVGFSIFYTKDNQKKFSSYYFHPSDSSDITACPDALTFLLNNQYNFLQTFTKKLSFVPPSTYKSTQNKTTKTAQYKDVSLNPYKIFKIIQKTNYFAFVKEIESYTLNIESDIKQYIDHSLELINKQNNKDKIEFTTLSFSFDLNIDESLSEQFKSNKNSNEKINEEELLKQYIIKGKYNVKELLFKYINIIIKKHKKKLKNTNYKIEFNYNFDLNEKNEFNFNLFINNKEDVKKVKLKRKLDNLYTRDYSSKLTKELLLSGKPIVLHSGGFDLLFLIHNFVFELPDNYNNFLEQLHNVQASYLYTKTNLQQKISELYKEINNEGLNGMFNSNLALLKEQEGKFKLLKEIDKKKFYSFKLFDTKNLLNVQYNKEILEILKIDKLKSLSNSFDLLNNHFIELNKKCNKEVIEYYTTDKEEIAENEFQAHHAGFDGEITGKVFYFTMHLVNKSIATLQQIENVIFLYNSYTNMNLKKV